MLASLVDGTEVLIRPIRASDKALLAAGLTRLSQRPVVRRFLTPKPSFTSTELRYLTEVDGIDHYALVAVEARRWDGDIVAVGRCARDAGHRGGADAAIVVCDALQGKGLGTRLATLLADSALRRGIGRIHADI